MTRRLAKPILAIAVAATLALAGCTADRNETDDQDDPGVGTYDAPPDGADEPQPGTPEPARPGGPRSPELVAQDASGMTAQAYRVAAAELITEAESVMSDADIDRPDISALAQHEEGLRALRADLDDLQPPESMFLAHDEVDKGLFKGAEALGIVTDCIERGEGHASCQIATANILLTEGSQHLEQAGQLVDS